MHPCPVANALIRSSMYIHTEGIYVYTLTEVIDRVYTHVLLSPYTWLTSPEAVLDKDVPGLPSAPLGGDN
jgi:hypothetical protein